MQLTHSFSTMFKLSIIDVQGWDLAHVREAAKLLSYFDKLIGRFKEVGAQIDNCQLVPVKRSFCTGAALAMEKAKGWYEARIAADAEKPQLVASRSANDASSRDRFDYLDDACLIGDGTWEEIMRDLMRE